MTSMIAPMENSLIDLIVSMDDKYLMDDKYQIDDKYRMDGKHRMDDKNLMDVVVRIKNSLVDLDPIECNSPDEMPIGVNCHCPDKALIDEYDRSDGMLIGGGVGCGCPVATGRLN